MDELATASEHQKPDEDYASAARREQPPPEPRGEDDLDQMLAEVAASPVARLAFEDAQARENLLLELVRARGTTSQREVAIAMGTTQSAVSDIENGRVDPRFSTVQRLARAVHRRLEFRVSDEQDDQHGRLKNETAAVGSGYTLTKVLTTLVRQQPTRGSQSYIDLSRRLQLPEVVVRDTVDRMQQTGWVTRVDDIEPARFGVREDRGLVIGISLSHRQIQCVLTNLRATAVRAEKVVPLGSMAPDDVVDSIAQVVDELRSDKSLGQGHEIVGLGVALAGLVDGPTGEVVFAPDLRTDEGPWRHVSLESILQDRTGLVTAVENDANALALHEYLLQGEEQSLAVVLISRSGEGLGGGLVVNGSLAHGIGGISGEIGHIVVDPEGPPCRCREGARGCLETYVSPSAIVRQIGERIRQIEKGGDVPPTSLQEAAELVARGNQSATSVFRSAGRKLGKALTDLTSVFGPNRIVLYGPAELLGDEAISAKAFLREVRSGEANIAFAVKVDMMPKVLSETSVACAAAATAVHYFLDQPWRWVKSFERPAELSQMALVGAL